MRNLRIFLLLTGCLTAGTIGAEVANWLATGGNGASETRIYADSVGTSRLENTTQVEITTQVDLSADESQQVRASES